MDIWSYIKELKMPGRIVLAGFSLDGTTLITAHERSKVLIWDTHVGEVIRQLDFADIESKTSSDKFTLFVESVALNRDGTQALIGFNNGTAELFLVETGASLLALTFPYDEPVTPTYKLVRSVNFSPDETLILVCFHRRTVGIWDRKKGQWKIFRRFSHPYSPNPDSLSFHARHISISNDNRYLFVVYSDLGTILWDTETNTLPVETYQYGDMILDVSVGSDKLAVATGYGFIWRLTELESSYSYLNHCFSSVMLSGNGNSFIGLTNNAIVYRISDEQIESVPIIDDDLAFDGLYSNIRHKFISANGEMIFYPLSKTQYVLRSRHKQIQHRTKDGIRGCLASPTQNILAVFSKKMVELWSILDQQLIGSIDLEGRFLDASFSNSGTLLAVELRIKKGDGSTEIRVVILDVSSQTVIHEIENQEDIGHMAFSWDEKSLLIAMRTNLVNWWPLGGRLKIQKPTKQLVVQSKEFMADYLFTLPDNLVVLIKYDGFEIWQDGEIQLYEIHDYSINIASKWFISSDYSTLAVVGNMLTIKCWNITNGTFIGEYKTDIPRPIVITDELETLHDVAFARLLSWNYKDTEFIYQPPSFLRSSRNFQWNRDKNMVLIPYEEGLALINLKHPANVIVFLPIEIPIVTTHVTDTHILALGNNHQLLRMPLPILGD